MSKIIVLTAGHSNTDPGAVNGSDRALKPSRATTESPI